MCINSLTPPGQHFIVVSTHSAIYLEFNSHHKEYKHSTNNQNSETLLNWTKSNHLYHVFDAKDQSSFKSAGWEQEDNPDMCLVSKKKSPTNHRKSTPRFSSKHRLVIIEIGTYITLVTTTHIRAGSLIKLIATTIDPTNTNLP